ncbi:MAG: hypothetical protein COZ18_13805 [Flexibacter sp. CG_4_10_14_3_um_filter_32_15]|nr:MAG: hypothetical protein COZ18_13805 [Flexibacter sp. CG_4_10_14_3_um_filter_32_15]
MKKLKGISVLLTFIYLYFQSYKSYQSFTKSVAVFAVNFLTQKNKAIFTVISNQQKLNCVKKRLIRKRN